MDKITNFALGLLANNPNIANNPRSKEMINIIKSGDQQKGEALARNLCATYGLTPEQGVAQARKFFNIP